MRNILLLTLTGLLLNLSSQAQIPKIKFGKVSKEELLMKEYEKDSSADAVILFNKGELHFVFSNETGFQYIYKEHLRIKIFNSNAFNYANHTFSLYHNRDQKEKLSLKAYTFNLTDGKIEKTKVNNNDILWETYNKNIDKGKIPMPSIIEGSVIDIEYTIISDYLYYLRSWQFQYEIPVIWSEYIVTIPEFFKYNDYYNGFYNLDINNKKNITETYVYNYYVEVFNGVTKVKNLKTAQLNSNSLQYHLASSHIPAFKKESFMPTSKKYLFEIEFELSSTKYPNQSYQNYAKNWSTINSELLQDEKFGTQLNVGFVKNEVKDIISKLQTEEDKMYVIYKYIQDNFKWNGQNTIFVSNSLRNVFNDKSGSSSELNLLLTLMLKTAGLNTNPVLISTSYPQLIKSTTNICICCLCSICFWGN